MNPYFLYMMEQEGLDDCVNTREAKLNAVAKDLKKVVAAGGDVNDYFISACENHNLTNVTEKEIKFINKKLL